MSSATTDNTENKGGGPILYTPPAAPAAQTLPPGDDKSMLGSDLAGSKDKYDNLMVADQGMSPPKGTNGNTSGGGNGRDMGSSRLREGRRTVATESPHRGWRVNTAQQFDSPVTMKSTETSFTYGDDTYQSMDDDQNRSVGSKSRLNTPGPNSVVSFDYTEDDTYDGRSAALDSFFQEDSDYYYVKQKFGYLSIGLSTTQLFILAVQMLLCGVAPFDVNPMIGPYPDVLSEWGGRNTYLIVERLQVWRLITPFALHTGVIHLLCNVAVQLETAAFFEREWGSFRWAMLYLSGAIGCNIASCLISPDEISVGSSGALMGLFGAKLAEVTTMSLFQTKRRRGDLGSSVRLEQLGGVLCAVAVVGMFTFIPYVDWAGHIGGLCGGFASGVVLFSGRLRSVFLKFIWGLTGIVFVIFGFVFSLVYLFQNIQADEELGDVCEYFRRLFAEGYECECLA